MTAVLRLPGAHPAEVTTPALMVRDAGDNGDLPALSWQETGEAGQTHWTTLTWAEAHDRTARLSAGLAALGAERGDHVLMMTGNRPEHWLTDLALVRLGALPVSVYGTAAPDQIAHTARHSRARPAVVHPSGTPGDPKAVDTSARLNRPGQVERCRLLSEERGPQTGELWPSLKLRRRAVRAKYGHVIEELCAQGQ